MPENPKQNENEYIPDWNKLTFLEKKGQSVEEKRDFPKGGFVESIVRIIDLALAVAGALTLIVILFIYCFNDGRNFEYNTGGYGILGFLFMVLFVLSGAIAAILTYFYDTKWVEAEDNLKKKALVNFSYYITIALFMGTFSLIPIRPAVINSTIGTTDAKWIGNLISYLNCGVMIALALTLGILEYVLKDEKKKKVLRLVFFFLFTIVPLCYLAILPNSHSMSGFATPMFVASSVAVFIADMLYLNEKKNAGFHTAANLFMFAAFSMEAINILYYGMYNATPLYN